MRGMSRRALQSEVAQLAELKAQLSSVSEPNIRVEYKPNRRQYLASVSTN